MVQIFFNGQVINTWKSDTAPSPVFFRGVSNECTHHRRCADSPYRPSLCHKQTCMINQFVVTLFFFFNWSSYDSDRTGFSYVNVHMQKQSVLHAHKDICKEFDYYGLLYKCVSRHFIINWNLTSSMLQVYQSLDLICGSYLYVLQSEYR